MSEQTNRGQQWLLTLLRHCRCEATVSVDQPDATLTKLKQFGGFWLTIDAGHLSPQQAQAFTSNEGIVLDAIQYLLNSTLNLGQSSETKEAYTVEISDFYRTQRYLELADLAYQAADELRQTGGEYEMPKLSAAERRLVHTVLCDVEDLETMSRGEGRR